MRLVGGQVHLAADDSRQLSGDTLHRRTAGGTGHPLYIQGNLLVFRLCPLLLSGAKTGTLNPFTKHLYRYLLRIIHNPRPVGCQIHLAACHSGQLPGDTLHCRTAGGAGHSFYYQCYFLIHVTHSSPIWQQTSFTAKLYTLLGYLYFQYTPLGYLCQGDFSQLRLFLF